VQVFYRSRNTNGSSLGLGIPIDSLQVSAQNKQSIRSAAFQITNILTRLHGKKDVMVSSDKSLEDLIGKITDVLSLLLISIASISLFVGGIGIMNMMLVSVTERTQEIGLRKALGATNQAILTQFLLEAIIMLVTGGLVGLAIGSGGILLVGIFSPIKPRVSVTAVVYQSEFLAVLVRSLALSPPDVLRNSIPLLP
jgi:putative ABC transport system permease protein